ncbi:MAG: hypothetical protein ACI8RD_010552 [Bacillariaceae sp.]|jgi:hypothetical protein
MSSERLKQKDHCQCIIGGDVLHETKDNKINSVRPSVQFLFIEENRNITVSSEINIIIAWLSQSLSVATLLSKFEPIGKQSIIAY